MPWQQRCQKLDEQSGAHPGAGVNDLNSDVAFALQLSEIALYSTARLAERAHQPGDGDVTGAACAVLAVDIFREFAGAASRAVRQVAVVLDACGHLRHKSAAVTRQCVPWFCFGWQMAGAQ